MTSTSPVGIGEPGLWIEGSGLLQRLANPRPSPTGRLGGAAAVAAAGFWQGWPRTAAPWQLEQLRGRAEGGLRRCWRARLGPHYSRFRAARPEAAGRELQEGGGGGVGEMGWIRRHGEGWVFDE